VGAFLRPGFSITGPLGLVGNLILIGALFLVAQVASFFWAIDAPAAPGGNTLWVAGAAVAAFAAALYLLASFVLRLRGGLIRIGAAAERIASGDLSLRLEAVEDDASDTGAMWNSVARMAGNLASIVGEVRSGSESILVASREISEGYTNLSQRTDRQAATLEETSSAMDELSATVRQNADNCRRASELARESSAVSERAAESMRRLTGTIGRIDAGSKRVAEIIGVIDGIAFQTGILALNAAVEAAHAGDQGRGFAVVASEVRSLAQRSADAAREVKALIEESVSSVDDGARLVRETEDAFGHAVARVGEVSGVIGEIASASAEQSAGVEEIKKALVQLENATQQNAALVEQSSAAVMSFQGAAERLDRAIAAFKTDRAEARERAIALVRQGIEHMRARGAEKALADFSDPRGGFVDGDRYLAVLDMNCILRANGGNPAIVGRDDSQLTDSDGKRFSAEFVNVALTRGRGWVDYRWMNPKTRRVEAKSTYVEREGEYVVACGIYRSDAEITPVEARPGAPRLTL